MLFRLNNAEEYRPLIVTYRNGSPVRLQDLGRVIDGIENDKTITWFNLNRALNMEVKRQPGTNTVETVDRILKEMPTFRAQLPPSVELNIVTDRSQAIRDSVEDVKFTLLLAVGLVVGRARRREDGAACLAQQVPGRSGTRGTWFKHEPGAAACPHDDAQLDRHGRRLLPGLQPDRSEEHTSELQSH